jgi:hypothetical protein
MFAVNPQNNIFVIFHQSALADVNIFQKPHVFQGLAAVGRKYVKFLLQRTSSAPTVPSGLNQQKGERLTPLPFSKANHGGTNNSPKTHFIYARFFWVVLSQSKRKRGD